jgi:hypothetical protein
LVGGDFANGGAGRVLVDDGFAVGVGGDERLDGEVVDRAGQPAGGLVGQRCGIVGEQGIGAPASLRWWARYPAVSA